MRDIIILGIVTLLLLTVTELDSWAVWMISALLLLIIGLRGAKSRLRERDWYSTDTA